MDVTRLYNLTTLELQQEAESLGITDADALSRAQLIHAIRNRRPEPKEGFLGKVFGIARWAIQEAGRPSEPPPRPTTPARMPDGVFSNRSTARPSMTPSRTAYEEPFPTRTMARILASQGHYKRALAIYHSLAEENPLDAALREEIEQTRKSATRALRMARGTS